MTDLRAPEPLVLEPRRRSIERMLDLGSTRKPARVLFATASEQPSADAVQRARELAQTVGAELHVLYVASELGRATQVELFALANAPARPSIPPGMAEATLSIQLQDPGPTQSDEAVSLTALETIATHEASDRVAQLPPPSVGVAPEQTATSEPTAAMEPASSSDALSSAASNLPAWCRDIFTEAQVATRVAIRDGDFVSTVSAHAATLGAALLIVSGHERPGGRIAALARESGCPVLVARARSSASNKVLAATDLTDERYPVLRLAYKFGGFLHASLVAVHNISPQAGEVSSLSRSQTRALATPDPELVTARLQALVDVTRSLGYETAVLSSMFDPVDAVLREARARQADTIMVGTREPRAGERSSVASQIVNLASQSVLVVPIDNLDSAMPARPHPVISLSTAEAIGG